MTSTNKTKAAHQRGEQLSDFIYHIASHEIPPAVLHEAKRALIDHLAVATGAVNDEAVLPVYQVARAWNTTGNARIIPGETCAPGIAAMVNATMAHAADYNDTHPAGAGHPGGPCWAFSSAWVGYRKTGCW